MAEVKGYREDLEEDTQKDKYLIFSIGDGCYGMEIKYVTEIIGIQPITTVPELPAYIKGIISLRGRIIPVVDARLRFKKAYREYDNRTCIIIIDIRGVSLGFIVDRVIEVLSIAEEDIALPPRLNGVPYNKYIKGMGKVGSEVKLLLDCENILNGEEFGELDEMPI